MSASWNVLRARELYRKTILFPLANRIGLRYDGAMPTARAPKEADYRRLARFRVALRRFLRFSENAARRAGISPAQYQLLLFVRSSDGGPPSIRDLAERLQILHQS